MDNQESFISIKRNMDSSGPPDGSDDEDSFVVLETSSTITSENVPSSSMNGEVLPLFRTNKVREMQNTIKMEISQITSVPEMPSAVDPLHAVASSVAKITISPDSSYEEIQKQVEELIKENETLKNIIAQNNMSMKTQYERFVAYRDEVTNVMKAYKEKLIEAKTCIDKFKEENAKLAGEVEVYINIKKLHEEEIINLKERVRKQENFSIVETLSGVIENTDNELQTELAKANMKVTELIAENERLKPEIQTLKNKTDDLLTKLTQANDNIEALDLENKKMNTEVENVSKLQQELSSKRQELEKLTERLVHTPRLEEQVQNKQEEINVLQFDLSALKNEVTKLRKENEDIKHKLCNASQESENLAHSAKVALSCEQALKVEVVNLTKAVEDARNLGTCQTKENHKLRVQLKALQEKYDPNIQEDYYQVKRQLSISQQTITALEAERETEAQEILQLRKLLEESENDEIFALKEQLIVYKTDYEAEKESKAALKREKDQIAEDLQNVQKRNKQLQNEIETLRARNETPKAEGYKCPKCDFGFSTYQSLENHVHRCLDLEGFP